MSQENILSTSPFADVMTHLHLPLIWARLKCGVRIEDLQQKRFVEALSLLQEHFVHEETLCRASELALDPVSVHSYVEMVRKWLHYGTSLCAVEEDSDAMVGFLLARVMSRLDHSHTQTRLQLLLFQGEAFHKAMRLLCHMVKTGNIFEKFHADSYFHIHALCVKPKFRGKGIGMGLLLSGMRLAITLKQTVVAGVFTSERSQSLGEKLGMEMVYEVSYADWSDDDDEIIFYNPGRGNYSSMLMAMEVPETFSDKKMYSLGQGL